MELINQIIPENILHALGWTVLHSLWQGLLIALLLAAFLFNWQKRDARQRYRVSFGALGLTLASAVVTFFILLKNENGEEAGRVFAEDGTVLGIYFFEATEAPLFFEDLNGYIPLIVLVWFIGMVFFFLKTLGGLLYVQRLKHRHLSAVPVAWEGVLENFKQRLGLSNAVRLTASAMVKVPMVVGWLKPVVLMPIGAVNQLSTEQVEAILAHELAHIARYDYLLNLLQSFVEILFYFNPAVWWISANIRTERENCCDDLAVKLCGNPLDYARALVSLQEMHQVTPAFALSFSRGKNQLLARIQRILNQPHKNPNAMEKISVIGLVLAAVITLSLQAKSDLNISPEEFDVFEADNAHFFETPEPEVFDFQTELDTVPKENVDIHWSDNDGTGALKIKDGEIIYLEIDGEEIPASEYEEHEELVAELLESLPMPPEPPTPPAFERDGFAEPPAPPSPPTFPRAFEVAPAPPAPPARKITTERNGKTTMLIIEGAPGTEPVEIEVESGRRGAVTINGEEVEGLRDGSQTITLEEDAPNIFYLDPNNNRNFWIPEIASVESFPSEDVWSVIAGERLLQFRDDDALQEYLIELGEHPFLLHDGGEARAHLFDMENNEELHELLDEERAQLFELKEEVFQQQKEALEQLRQQESELRKMEKLQEQEAMRQFRHQQAELRKMEKFQRQETLREFKEAQLRNQELQQEYRRQLRDRARARKAQ